MTADASSRTWSRPLSPAQLGAFIREARLEAGLSQEDLADELGFDRRALQRIEAGDPTLYATRVFALLRTLGIRMELSRP